MRLVMMGTGPFAVPTFESLLESQHQVLALFTRPTSPRRGRQKTAPNPMRDVAVSRGVDVLEPQSVNDQDAQRQLLDLQADLLIVCDYGQILSRDTLATAPRGGINLHASLLPKYRGAAPINWAIYHGESTTGVTVIHMSPQLDAGPCLARRSVDIGVEETAVELELRLSRLGVQVVLDSIQQLQDWDGQSQLGSPQEASLASKAPRLKKQDGQVDWRRAAEQIKDQVRAFKPWPKTFTFWHRRDGQSMRLILDRVTVCDQTTLPQAPGHVVRSDGKRLEVATGQGTLSVERVQPAGKRVMEIEELLRGYRVSAEERFGPED